MRETGELHSTRVDFSPPDPEGAKELIASIPDDLSIPDFLRRDKRPTSGSTV
jgi:hypothetical protein